MLTCMWSGVWQRGGGKDKVFVPLYVYIRWKRNDLFLHERQTLEAYYGHKTATLRSTRELNGVRPGSVHTMDTARVSNHHKNIRLGKS